VARVRYARSLRDLERDLSLAETPPRELEVRSIRCVYESDSEVVQAVVPRPLEASPQAEVVVAFETLAWTLSSDVSVRFRSATFGVRVEYEGQPGIYPLTMPVDSEQVLVVGRERFGEPRKLAEVSLDGPTSEGTVSASVERMGVRFLAATGRLGESLGAREETEHAYCFKAFPSGDGRKGFDQDPQLVRLDLAHRFDRVWRLSGGLDLWESAYDPVADLPLRRLSGLVYAEGRTLRSGRALRPVPGEWLRPFLHQRYDAPDVEGVDV
jgi:acetoacetate decarboxylase